MRKHLLSMLLSIILICTTILLVGCNNTHDNTNGNCDGTTSYTVNFYVDGELKTTIDIDSSFELPENPTKEGYDFDGWYFDENSWQKPLTSISLFNEEKNTEVSVYEQEIIIIIRQLNCKLLLMKVMILMDGILIPL